MGGAQGTWNAGVQDRNLGALSGLVASAGDAGALRRNSNAGKTALSNFGITDTRRAAQGQQIGQLDALRRQLIQRRMARLQNQSQGTFDQAGRAGDDLMMGGSLLNMGGSLAGGSSTDAGPGYTQWGGQWYKDGE